MIELLIAFTAGIAAGMAIEGAVRRVEWRSVLRRRAKTGPRRKEHWTLPRSARSVFEPTSMTKIVGLDEMMADLRQNAELRPEGTDD